MRSHYCSGSPGLLFLLFCLPLLATWASFAVVDTPERIISMAPSTTEILFELGFGNRVVGVTRYCDYPEAAKDITKVGGYVDPSYETIVALKPDLVVLLSSHQATKRELAKLNVQTLMIPHETLADIHAAIQTIGNVCGRQDQAAALLGTLKQRSEAVREAVQERPKPTVLICIGRDMDADRLSGIYVAGRNGFYDEIIALAGGVNVYQAVTAAYPQVSLESIIRLNPEVIVDLVDAPPAEGESAAAFATPWNQLHTVAAVREKRVHVITGMHALRPGPRYPRFLEELARLLHPACFQQEASHD